MHDSRIRVSVYNNTSVSSSKLTNKQSFCARMLLDHQFILEHIKQQWQILERENSVKFL